MKVTSEGPERSVDWDRVYERFQQAVNVLTEALIPCYDAATDALTALCEALQGIGLEDEPTVKNRPNKLQNVPKQPSRVFQRVLSTPFCSYKPNLHLPRHLPHQMRRY